MRLPNLNFIFSAYLLLLIATVGVGLNEISKKDSQLTKISSIVSDIEITDTDSAADFDFKKIEFKEFLHDLSRNVRRSSTDLKKDHFSFNLPKNYYKILLQPPKFESV